MELQRLHDFKQWLIDHPLHHGVESGLCDAVLAAWLAGWMLLPVLALLGQWVWLPTSLALRLAPPIYWTLRRALHRRGLLRCDWLHTVAPPR